MLYDFTFSQRSKEDVEYQLILDNGMDFIQEEILRGEDPHRALALIQAAEDKQKAEAAAVSDIKTGMGQCDPHRSFALI